MMRYYNENPQVVLLADRCEKLEKENAELNERIDELMYENHKQSSFRRAEYDMYQDLKKQLQSECDNVNLEIERFNSLPWYKKMFFKFKL